MSRNELELYNQVAKALEKKWGGLLEGIKNDRTRLNTAVLLENEHQKGGLLTEETASGQTAGYGFGSDGAVGTGTDIAPFQHYLLPLVRRVYPNLIANELVGVQPMTSPASLVFYLKYKYTGLVNPDTVSNNVVTPSASDKGWTSAGIEYANFSGNSWQIDPYYSLQTVFREPTAPTADITADAGQWSDIGSTTVTRTPIASPVVSGSVSQSVALVVVVTTATGDSPVTGFTVAATNAALTGGAGSDTFSGRIDSTTGQVIIVNTSIAGGAAGNITGIKKTGSSGSITYDYNMEGNRTLPEMELEVSSHPVSAKTRKLRTKWTIEAAQDLRAMHNIDAEQELISVLANEVTAEIDREIINDLVVNAQINVDYDYSNPFLVGGAMTAAAANTAAGGTAAYVIPGATNFDDRNKALFYQILEVSNQIYRQSLRGAGNWIVTSPEVAAKLESLLEFKPDARTDTTYNLGIQYSGTLNGQFKLYKDPLFSKALILVGFKGSSFMDAGYFYCPYIPLQLTPTVLDPESFNPRKGLITRYGKVMVENGGRMYGRIRVSNLSAIGAGDLPGASVTTTPHIGGQTISNAVAGSTDI